MRYLIFNLFILFISNILVKYIIIGGWGIGVWGWGIGDWAQSPIPNPQSPIPNPQHLFFNSDSTMLL